MMIPYTQFMRPNGRQVQHQIHISDDNAEKWKTVSDLGLRITMEVVMPGVVNICLEDPEVEDDFLFRVVTNDERVSIAIETFLNTFDVAQHAEWRTMVATGEGDEW